MWAIYTRASLAIKVIRDRCPYELNKWLQLSLYVNDRRPNYGRFMDNSRGKIGRYRFENRLAWMNDLPWYNKTLTAAGIRTLLKDRLDFNFDRQ